MYKNKVVWITGASSGIGEALTLAFAAEGAKVVLSARRQEELQRVADRCVKEAGANKDDLLVLPLDVTDFESLADKAAQVTGKFSKIDLLINNAGVSQRSAVVDTDLTVYQRLLDVDVLGQIALTKAVLPDMLKRGSGHLAVTSSIAGRVGARKRSGYCAAKYAITGFFDSMRTEVEDEGVNVTTIFPGYINTPVSDNALRGDGSAYGKRDKTTAGGMSAEDCAQIIMKGLSKGKREIYVGSGTEMYAPLLKRLSPELAFWVTKKQS